MKFKKSLQYRVKVNDLLSKVDFKHVYESQGDKKKKKIILYFNSISQVDLKLKSSR